jgi:hypothetical protein
LNNWTTKFSGVDLLSSIWSYLISLGTTHCISSYFCDFATPFFQILPDFDEAVYLSNKIHDPIFFALEVDTRLCHHGEFDSEDVRLGLIPSTVYVPQLLNYFGQFLPLIREDFFSSKGHRPVLVLGVG